MRIEIALSARATGNEKIYIIKNLNCHFSNYSLPMRNKVMQQFCDGKIQGALEMHFFLQMASIIQFPALIATDSMARGHDIPDVTHVSYLFFFLESNIALLLVEINTMKVKIPRTLSF